LFFVFRLATGKRETSTAETINVPVIFQPYANST